MEKQNNKIIKKKDYYGIFVRIIKKFKDYFSLDN